MKKINLLIIVLIISAILTGCGNKTAKVSDENSVLIQFGNTKITKADLYEEMTEADGGATVINLIEKYILDKEVETTDEIKEQANTRLADIKEQMDGDLSNVLKSYGFETEEELLEQIVYAVKSDLLIDRYITEKTDDIFKEYAPFKAKMIYVEINTEEDAEGTKAKEEAQKALDALKAGTDFATVAEEYSDKASLAEETLYNSNSSIDYNVLKFAQTIDSPSLSDVIASNDKKGYYICQVTVTNREQLKDDFFAALKKDTDFTAEIDTYYFRQHNFTVYDVLTESYLEKNYPTYLKPETDSSENN